VFFFGPGAKGRVWGSYVVLKAPLTPVPRSSAFAFPTGAWQFFIYLQKAI